MSASPCIDNVSGNELIEQQILELREEIQKHKPGKMSKFAEKGIFPEKLLIGLFGRTGCGKTSLINSLKFAAQGKLREARWLQIADQVKAGGHTMFRRLADITENIYVVDNRGLDEPNTGQAIIELSAQLDGIRGYSELVEWQADNAEDDDDDLNLSEIDPKAENPIGCAVFVFSALIDIDTNTNGLTEVVNFLHVHQGRYPVAVITHVDVADESNVENLKTVLAFSGVSNIFTVANLTSERKALEEPHQLSLLYLLERCMADGDETLIFKNHQRKDQQRKKVIEKAREEKRLKQKKEQEAKANETEQRLKEVIRKAELEKQQDIEKIRKQEKEQDEKSIETERRLQEVIRMAEIEKLKDIEKIRKQEEDRSIKAIASERSAHEGIQKIMQDNKTEISKLRQERDNQREAELARERHLHQTIILKEAEKHAEVVRVLTEKKRCCTIA